MEALVHKRKDLVLSLVKKRQNFVWVCIIIAIMVIFLLMENKSLNLKPMMEIPTFQLGFV